MATDWDSGYVSDIEYVPGYYREQSPSVIETICIANGIESPVNDNGNFTYCELGCGLGETSLLTAATAPKSQVYAFDFNPAHIANARKLAQKCGIDNIYFGEQSFQQLAEGDVPDNMPLFDYVTLHGIWTWINNENRAYIVEFLSRYLKPSGIVYVSYNALPGFSSLIPFQNLFFTLANEETGNTRQRAEKAIAKIKNMLKVGINYLPKEVETILSKNPIYLSHEYLNASWNPTFHHQVADDLQKAKLTYLGSATLIENYADYMFTPEQKQHLNAASPESVETLKDYFTTRFFRRDLFIRGKRSYPYNKAIENILNTTIQLTVPSENFNYFMQAPLGRINFKPECYKSIIDALDKNGSMRIQDILELKDVKENNVTPAAILATMLGSKQAVRVLPKKCQPDIKHIKKINKALVEDNINYQRTKSALASATTGEAIYIQDYALFAYHALSNGCPEKIDNLLNAVIDIMRNIGSKVTKDKEIVTDEAQAREIIKSNLEIILKHSLPLWKKLGAY